MNVDIHSTTSFIGQIVSFIPFEDRVICIVTDRNYVSNICMVREWKNILKNNVIFQLEGIILPKDFVMMGNNVLIIASNGVFISEGQKIKIINRFNGHIFISNIFKIGSDAVFLTIDRMHKRFYIHRVSGKTMTSVPFNPPLAMIHSRIEPYAQIFGVDDQRIVLMGMRSRIYGPEEYYSIFEMTLNGDIKQSNHTRIPISKYTYCISEAGENRWAILIQSLGKTCVYKIQIINNIGNIEYVYDTQMKYESEVIDSMRVLNRNIYYKYKNSIFMIRPK